MERFKHIGIRIGFWFMAFLCLTTASSLAQETNRPVFERTLNPVLSSKQQHYLNTIKGYDQYIHHEFIIINPAAFKQETLFIPMFEGELMAASSNRIVERAKDDISWMGTFADHERSSCNLVLNGTMVSANFRFDGDLYSIWPLGEGLHVLTHEDGSKFQDHNEAEYKSLPSYDMKNGIQERHFDGGGKERYIPSFETSDEQFGRGGAADCKIRLLVAYTDDVDAANADPRGQIQLAIDNYNASSANSGVNYEVEPARIVEVGYAESGVFSTDRNRFRNTTDGYMDAIHDLRALYDADYCQLVVQNVNEGEGCGLAYGIGVTYADAFCASAYGCIAGNLTFAHEFAHLHGCRHDTYVDNTNTPFSYGHGYVNIPDNWRTVMAYNDACEDAGTNCTRIQYWSTPDVSVPAIWGGDAAGTNSTNYNEAVLDNTEATVAGWEAMVSNKTVYGADIVYADQEGNFEGSSSVSTVSGTSLEYRSGSKGVMRAETSVTLADGFWAQAGSDFTAYLQSCAVVTADQRQSYRIDNEYAPTDDGLRLKVLPNPFSSDFDVILETTDQELRNVHIALIDLQGKTVARLITGVDLNEGLHRYKFSTDQISSGVYMLMIQTDEKRTFERIVKSK